FLKGKSFENIRNRVNKFHREHPEAEIRLFEADHYDDLLTLGKTWKDTSGKKYSHVYDGVYYKQLVKHYRELNQKILTVRIDGKLVGMISGSGLPNGQAWGSVIKFAQGIPGLSETLTVEFAKLLYKPKGGPEFLNVGSDLGFEGLKMFKLKFRPVLNYRRYELFLK
ncbi:MAG TPA: phosphatidylglycerol lysyltransferase domain-containing protein, partial [Clostridia bacterium]|nr:phosphatidylglycerol lysyltransferase domain-containing protein [Clostridia bacterium]